MKLLVASGLTAALLTGSAGAVALVAGVPDQAQLPGQAQVPEVEAPEVPQSPAVEPSAEAPVDATGTHEEGADQDRPASAVGAERHAAAMDFVALMQEWSACVGDAAEAHEGSTERFSPQEACGDRPAPPVPDHAADKVPSTPGASTHSDSAGRNLPLEGEAGRGPAEERAAEGQSRGEGGPGNAPADLPGGRP